MKLNKKAVLCGIGIISTMLCLTACSPDRVSELFSGNRGVSMESMEDFQITLTGSDGSSTYELEEGTCVYGAGEHTYVDTLQGEDPECYEQVISALGISPGDELDLVLSLPEMKENYAVLQYETDLNGDGTGNTEKENYTGTMIDLDELNCLDCMVTFAWYQEEGSWKQLDFSSDDIENHTQVITIAFDIQGPAADYGVLDGQVCGIFCEYH